MHFSCNADSGSAHAARYINQYSTPQIYTQTQVLNSPFIASPHIHSLTFIPLQQIFYRLQVQYNYASYGSHPGSRGRRSRHAGGITGCLSRSTVRQGKVWEGEGEGLGWAEGKVWEGQEWYGRVW